jgi:hypothetical protein
LAGICTPDLKTHQYPRSTIAIVELLVPRLRGALLAGSRANAVIRAGSLPPDNVTMPLSRRRKRSVLSAGWRKPLRR